ncbi:MAG: tryptophan-rich sensory protein [Opitutales bacterium]|nr:tryptophan-rich sensory protein [Opitutales bacterium]
MSYTRISLGLFIWLVLCFGAAAVGSFFSPGEWYASLNKPTWNPPSWVFGPVWTLLYALMAISAWLVWVRGGFSAQRGPLSLFLLQLALNAAWSPVFFGLERPDLAFLVILFLWLGIVATIIAFRKVSHPATTLLLPYLAWVSFATALNGAIWILNT